MCSSPRAALLLLGAVLLASCDTTTPDPRDEPDLDLPVVTGIEVFDEWANRIGTYGSPAKPPVPAGFSVSPAFPNPSAGPVLIRFTVAEEGSSIRVWAEPGVGPAAASAFVEPPAADTAPRTLLEEQQIARGVHQFAWDHARDLGVSVPDGFYRIHIQVGEEESWADVLLFDEYEELEAFFQTAM